MIKAIAKDSFKVSAAMAAALFALPGHFFCTFNDVASYNFNHSLYFTLPAYGPVLLAAAIAGIAIGRRFPSPAASSPNPLSENESNIRLACALQVMEETALELRNPVNTIVGFSEILVSAASGSRGEGERDSYCQFILDNSRTLSGFVPQLLDYARYERERLHLVEQDVDAAELAEAAVRLCREVAESRDVGIVARLLDGIELRCDSGRIRRSLASFVTRAVTAAPLGSDIDISFDRTGDGGLVFVISNPGETPSPEESQRLFEPDLGREGLSGLSLAVASRIMLLHSGEVTIGRAVGAGTVTRIVLPANRVFWPSDGRTDSRSAP